MNSLNTCKFIQKERPLFHGRLVFSIFVPLSIFMLGSGVGALVTSILRGECGPASFFFLAIGAGLVAGALLSRIAYRGKFKNSL